MPPGVTPKGAADIAKQRAEDRPQAMRTVATSEANIDKAIGQIRDILRTGGLWTGSGVTAPLSWVPGTAAADMSARLDTLKTQLGMAAMQEMRDASKTGGAVGQVTEREWGFLMNSLEPLTKWQSSEQLLTALNQVVQHLEGAKVRIRGAFTETYGDRRARPRGGAAPAAPAGPTVDDLLRKYGGG